MDSIELEGIVRTIVAHHLGVDESAVGLDDSFLENLGADSLDSVEMVRDVEDRFHIEVAASEIQNFDSVRTIVEYLSGKISDS